MFSGDAPEGDKQSFASGMKQWLFWAVHASCLLAFYVGFSWAALGVCVALYVVRMFGITGVYHRYFSHRTYQTSRVFQFMLACLGCSAAQKGPIWWASHHRHHHRHSDTPEDAHSPIVKGIYYAHLGWVLSDEFVHTKYELVKDLMRFPELRWIERYHLLPVVTLAAGTFFLGQFLGSAYPSLGTSGSQMLVWGFFISTTFLYHGTFSINSFAHIVGNQRFKTGEHSKNSALLAIITLGEGWHNNHHRYPGSERQGMYWWEFDVSHYILKTLSVFGLVWDIRLHPERVYEEASSGGVRLDIEPSAKPINDTKKAA